MTNGRAKRPGKVLRNAALACACLSIPVTAQATSCAVEMLTLARVQGRVRYVAGPDEPHRVAAGVRVEIAAVVVGREPKVVAAVESDAEGRFAFKTLKPGRPYLLSFHASGSFGLVNVRLEPSSPHTWLTMDLGNEPDRGCPANRVRVGKPE